MSPCPQPTARVALCALIVAALACAAPQHAPPADDGVIRVTSGDPERPLLRYRDGQLSENTSCMIRLDNPLNPKVPPMYVNGRPLGFC